MKKLLILLLSALSLMAMAEDKQVAILEPIAMTKEVSTMHRSMVRGEMVKAISRQSGYAAFTRTDIDQIMSEQNFQQSGMVDDATRKRLGAMQGVDYVCVTKITKEGNNYYLEANLVNIETGKISNPATQYGELDGGSLSNMLVACENLAAELVGKTVQTTTTIYAAPANIESQTNNPSFPQPVAKQNSTEELNKNTLHESTDLGEYRISLDSAKIELQKIILDPALRTKFLSNPELGKALMLRTESEYNSVLHLELSKGTPKKQAKEIAKQAKDSIGTIVLLEYVRRNPIGD
jgi:hypothetical protein